jgi:hypothetical protein
MFILFPANDSKCTLQIQCSGQRIEYFETLQRNCGVEIPLKIPLHSNVRWGTAEGMLGRAYELRQVCSSVLLRVYQCADFIYSPSICS